MTTTTLALETHSPEQTEALGFALADLLPFGAVVALRGELASGKTCLVRGMAARIAPEAHVSSPTFTLVNQYGEDPKLYHVDLYRLTGPGEVVDLGYEELFDPDGICVIEWAERAEALLPERRLDVVLEHAGEDRRRITLDDRGLLGPEWPEALKARV